MTATGGRAEWSAPDGDEAAAAVGGVRIARKRELTKAVLAGGETALTELSDSELSALVSLGADPSAGG